MKRALALLLLVATWRAEAHPLAPGLLELVQTGPERYAVTWRTSVARAGSASVEPRLPAECRALSQAQPRIEQGEALVARWLVECPGGLDGRTVAVDAIEASGINVIVRVVEAGREFKTLLGADAPSATIAFDAQPVFARYLRLGAAHLAGGVDHLLFLLGLFLLVPSLRALVATVTMFTVGHSLTLALAVLGRAPMSQPVAELLIAATILWLALQLAKKGSDDFSKKHLTPFFAPLVFGLIHGLGFAGALRGVGLPPGDVVPALLGFNAGIELAQLAVIAALLVAARIWRTLPAGPELAHAVPAHVTGALAVCWMLERSLALLA